MTKKACAMHPAVFLTMPRISPSTICMTYANTAREALFFFFCRYNFLKGRKYSKFIFHNLGLGYLFRDFNNSQQQQHQHICLASKIAFSLFI